MNLKTLYKNNKGLTLLEVLVVLVILGLLATIAAPAVKQAVSQPERAVHLNNAKIIVSTLENMNLYGGEFDGLSAGAERVYSLNEIINLGYLENLQYPGNGSDKAYDLGASKGIVKKKADSSGYSYDVILKKAGGTDWYIINRASAYRGFNASNHFSCQVSGEDAGIEFITLSKGEYDAAVAVNHTDPGNCPDKHS